MNVITIEAGSEAYSHIVRAVRSDRKISLMLDEGLKIKVGEDIWSLPLSTDLR
jgi:hypothetical protein